MVFEWFFGKGRKKSLFKLFLEEIAKLERIDKALDKCASGEKVDEVGERAQIVALVRHLEILFKDFLGRIDQNRATLQEYIESSVDMHDYLTEIDAINSRIMSSFAKINDELHKDLFEEFIVESSNMREKINQSLVELKDKMLKFRNQSKDSLAWHFRSGSNNVDLPDFKGCVRDLGGKIVPKPGGGSHFDVIFGVFTNTLGPSKNNENMIAGRTLESFIDARAALISPHVKVDYLKCYFFHNIPDFRSVFVRKYKRLFEV
jgi:hypothetical protein